jgi:IS30 family transposase
MANQLKMAMVHAIITLLERGWSYRRIARELGLHRETVARRGSLPWERSATVGRQARLAQERCAKPTISIARSEVGKLVWGHPWGPIAALRYGI